VITLPCMPHSEESQDRITLVEPDGSPAVPWYLDPAPSVWDNHYWEPGSCPEDLASHVAAVIREPEETDAEFLARLGHEEDLERQRLANTYYPTAADLAEYGAWLESIGDGPEPWAVEPGHSFEDWGALRGPREPWGADEQHAIRSGQISADELSMMAAGMAI
jgi:hypothetical protein